MASLAIYSIVWQISYIIVLSELRYLGNDVSSFKHVSCGVPQRSVLVLLLFLIYINDIADLLSDAVNIKLLADDIKIYLEITVSALPSFHKNVDDNATWSATCMAA